MKKSIAVILLTLLVSLNANADVWRWTDANGDVHFVTSKKPIYTWQDESGKVFYADKPGPENAVSVALVWHSTGDAVEEADEQPAARASSGGWARPDETEAEQQEREMAEQYYCKRAQDIYNSYLNAPRLYETDEKGEKVYLSEEQTAAKIKETEVAVAQVCQ